MSEPPITGPTAMPKPVTLMNTASARPCSFSGK